MKHHTVISATEIDWEDSGAARVSDILTLGNETWTDENVPSHPVNRVKPRAGRFITAYGITAAERRLPSLSSGMTVGLATGGRRRPPARLERSGPLPPHPERHPFVHVYHQPISHEEFPL